MFPIKQASRHLSRQHPQALARGGVNLQKPLERHPVAQRFDCSIVSTYPEGYVGVILM